MRSTQVPFNCVKTILLNQGLLSVMASHKHHGCILSLFARYVAIRTRELNTRTYFAARDMLHSKGKGKHLQQFLTRLMQRQGWTMVAGEHDGGE
jgi:hypothetical protein